MNTHLLLVNENGIQIIRQNLEIIFTNRPANDFL